LKHALSIKTDGKIIDILLSSTQIDPNNFDKGVTFTALDITKRKKAEAELQKYREHLEKLVKERTDDLETANEELKSNIEEQHATIEELDEANKELERFNKLFIDREFRIKELRDKVKEFEEKLSTR